MIWSATAHRLGESRRRRHHPRSDRRRRRGERRPRRFPAEKLDGLLAREKGIPIFHFSSFAADEVEVEMRTPSENAARRAGK
jgi:hypothetical protein